MPASTDSSRIQHHGKMLTSNSGHWGRNFEGGRGGKNITDDSDDGVVRDCGNMKYTGDGDLRGCNECI